MKLKVCGITTLSQLQQLDCMGIQYAGMIFYEKSPRCIKGRLQASEVKERKFALKKVGVFVDASINDVLEEINAYGLDAIQLHGSEAPEYCEELSKSIEVIKAFGIGMEGVNNELLESYIGTCKYFLFDTKKGNAAGGTGEKFDWKCLMDYSGYTPFFLSGGIGADDASTLATFEHPALYGVDINSRFEISPGIKNLGLVEKFKQDLKK